MDIVKLNDVNRRFDERLNELISLKGQNTQSFTTESYTEMINKVKSSKSKKSHKKPEDYQRLRRFDVMTVGETEKLIVPVKDNIIRYYVRSSDIFQILHDTHLKIGHGGRNRMEKELNLHYKNITREMIIIYLNLCDSCERKRSVPKKGLVMTLPGPPAGPSKIIYVKTIDPNATTKDPLDPLNRRSQRCRFCFQFSEECIPISPNYLADDKTTLAFNNVQVQLDFADNFPNVVCKDCDVKLQIMYDFVKDVKAAQESLVNIEVEMESRREDTGIEMVTVKTEYEDNDENDSPDEDDNDNNYDSPDEDDNEDNDTKEGIIDSLAVGETNFTKQIITQKRKNTTGAETPKKAKVADYEYTEFVMDIKEEVIERNDTTDANNAGLTDTGTPGIDVTPCIEEFTKKSSVHTMRSDGNS